VEHIPDENGNGAVDEGGEPDDEAAGDGALD
jgi:hypothetical protein